MKFHQQETKHNPPESYGDCIRTCLACLLDREPLSVPNFFAPPEFDTDDPWRLLEEWLSDAGFASVKMHVGGELAGLQKYMAVMNPGVLYILMGDGHAVIGCGDRVLHDPSWLQLGVKEPSHIMFLLPAAMRYAPSDCPICGGDCTGANPPVANCPNQK